jgi:hypothetical protein
MSVTRRKFMKSGALTALSAGLVFNAADFAFGQKKKVPERPVLKSEVPYEAGQNPIIYYNYATFEPYIGGTFIGRDARGQAIELKLLRATQYKPASKPITNSRPRDTESFTLTFTASRALPEFTSIHVIEHPVLGKFDLFLQRTGDTSEMLYQAVITHLV